MRTIVIGRTVRRLSDWSVMMMTTTKTHYARASAAAIAAVLALSSTAAIAQEAQPAPTDTTPTTPTDTAPAATTAEPAVTPGPAANDTATAATHTAKATKARTAARTATKAATKAATAAKVATHAAARSTAAHSAAAVAAAAPVAAAPAAKPAPVVDMTAKPAQPAPQPAAKPATNNDAALEMGGGALAILALGAGAFALARRRRHADEEVWEEDQVETPAMASAEDEREQVVTPRHDPVGTYEPPVRVPEDQSAFAWNRETARDERIERSSDERRPGESWVDRAYRGPTADNPSQSLRKRLKRAAFFDKREREAAANQAAPVEADAGLPERAMAERELEAV